MSDALQARIARSWHHPTIQNLLAGRGEALWRAGPQAIFNELRGLQRTDPKAYWSEPVQEALQLAAAAREYAAGNTGAADRLPPEPQKSEAQQWAEFRAAGGRTASGGAMADLTASADAIEPPEGRRALAAPAPEQRANIIRVTTALPSGPTISARSEE